MWTLSSCHYQGALLTKNYRLKKCRARQAKVVYAQIFRFKSVLFNSGLHHPYLASHHIKTEPLLDTSPPYPLSVDSLPPCSLPVDTSSPCSLPGGKTTAYTYQAFFASDGRSKNMPGNPFFAACWVNIILARSWQASGCKILTYKIIIKGPRP